MTPPDSDPDSSASASSNADSGPESSSTPPSGSAVRLGRLTIPAGLDRIVVLQVRVVFIIMTATVLLAATIKLQQNLAGSTPVSR